MSLHFIQLELRIIIIFIALYKRKTNKFLEQTVLFYYIKYEILILFRTGLSTTLLMYKKEFNTCTHDIR